MKKSNMENSKSAGGKGFYLALMLSVAAVGTVAYFTIDRLNNSLTSLEDTGSKQNVEWSLPDELTEVDRSQSDVPKAAGSTPESKPEEQKPTVTSEETVAKEEETFFNKPKAEEQKVEQSAGYILPIEGEVLNPYSGGELVKSKTLGEWRTHDGVDFKAAEGTPVKAVGNGTVTKVTEDRQWGVLVEVQHKDFAATYAGIAPEVAVAEGAEVALGDVLGYVGNSSVIESAEENHLHFAVKVNGQWADPMKALGK